MITEKSKLVILKVPSHFQHMEVGTDTAHLVLIEWMNEKLKEGLLFVAMLPGGYPGMFSMNTVFLDINGEHDGDF